MRKLMMAALAAAAALGGGGAAFAQASNYDNATQGGTIYNPPYPLPPGLEQKRNAPPESNYWNNGSRGNYPYGYSGNPNGYGNYGYNGNPYNANPYGYRYGYPPAVAEGGRRQHDGNANDPRVSGNRGNHRGNKGDRDGDGVPNNADRYPNDPSRW